LGRGRSHLESASKETACLQRGGPSEKGKVFAGEGRKGVDDGKKVSGNPLLETF